ncbi:cyd operon YbgE family protein [Thiobacillus sp.]
MKNAFNTGWVRAGSLGTALMMMVLITVFPRGLTAAGGSPISHGILTLIMWGLSAGFVHGVGFVPRNPVLRVVLGPLIAWPLMGLGLVCYIWYFLR